MPTKTELIRTALRRFPHYSAQALGEYLMHNYEESCGQTLDPLILAVQKAREQARTPGVIKQPRSLSPNVEPYCLTPGTWLVLSDVHVPFHEPEAVELAIGYGLDRKVDGILLDGDFQDCAAISKWRTAKRDFVREVELTIDMLDWLRDVVGDIPIVWKPGNHEDRLRDYYIDHAPVMVGLGTASLETVLGLEHRKIKYLQSKQIAKAGHLHILHGNEIYSTTGGVNPARTLFLKTGGLSVCGHFHRSSMQPFRSIKGELIKCWSVGCLCDLTPGYNPIGNSWNHGFGVVSFDKSGAFEFENKDITEGKVV